MPWQSNVRYVSAAALLLLASASLVKTSSVQAQDFFSLFGGLDPRPAPQIRMPAPVEEAPAPRYRPRYEAPRVISHLDEQTWCVRTCDGRYFPAQGNDRESRARSCNSFCPASQTTMVYGGDIDEATTESGKSYSDLPNAFRYRKEMVAGCTCNGKDPAGLAAIKITDDPTLRKGDIVAKPDGLVVAGHDAGARRGVAMNFSPLPETVRSKFRQLPVVARE